MDSSSLIERLRAGDTTGGGRPLTKIRLTQLDDKRHIQDLLELFPTNTTITHVTLEGRFVNSLSSSAASGGGSSVPHDNVNNNENKDEYGQLLQAISQLKGLQEVEVRNAKVPLATLSAALQTCPTLRKLALHIVSLYDVPHHTTTTIDNNNNDNNRLPFAAHPSLQSFCMSEFRWDSRLEENFQQQQQPPPQEAIPQPEQAQQQQQQQPADQPEGDNGGGNNDTNNNDAAIPCRLDDFLRGIATCPKLETVELVSSRMDPHDGALQPWSADALASLVRDSPLGQLRTLILRRVFLPVAHVVALAHALRTRYEQQRQAPPIHLQNIDLSENGLPDVASVAMVQSAVHYCPHHVKVLNLRDNAITNVGCEQMAQALLFVPPQQPENGEQGGDRLWMQNYGIEKINLKGNPIGNHGACALAQVLQNHVQQQQHVNPLKHLELAKTGIQEPGCIALARAIRDNTTLLSLGLAYNELTNATYLAFVEALQVNRTLKALNLHVSYIKNLKVEAMEAMVDMLRDNDVLEDLNTFFNDGVDTWKNRLKMMTNTFLRLNQAGRRELLRGHPSKEEWITMISRVSNDFHSIYYLVLERPSICNRFEA